MKLGISLFVRDKNGNLVDRYNFCADDEESLCAAVNLFTYEMEPYYKDYKIMSTPLQFIFEEHD